MKKTLLAFLFSFVFLSGCSATNNADDSSFEDASDNISMSSTNEDSAPIKIDAAEAYQMIQEGSNIIILDVRTQEEFDTGHIKNAILIPNEQITVDAENMLTDKDATILVYCRSGRRSALAADALVQMGYTAIYDFGGINDWPYDVVTEE